MDRVFHGWWYMSQPNLFSSWSFWRSNVAQWCLTVCAALTALSVLVIASSYWCFIPSMVCCTMRGVPGCIRCKFNCLDTLYVFLAYQTETLIPFICFHVSRVSPHLTSSTLLVRLEPILRTKLGTLRIIRYFNARNDAEKYLLLKEAIVCIQRFTPVSFSKTSSCSNADA